MAPSSQELEPPQSPGRFNDIDAYFFSPGATDAVARLKVFREIILAVEALHRLDVFHRDLKVDNLREAERAFRRFIVAIDLGTAARSTSARLISNYDTPTGALPYSSSEALAGLAGNRIIARFTDVYALGCMLFELFNPDFFFRAFLVNNPFYKSLIHGMNGYLIPHSSDADQRKQWRRALDDLGAGVAQIDIDDMGSSVPSGIADLLNELLHRLTHVDFARRPTLEWARWRVEIAIRVLQNQREYNRMSELKKERRKARIEQQRIKDERHIRGRPNIPQVANA